MTVGYPIKSNGNVYGGIFVCSPVPEIQETLMNVIEIMIFSVVVGFGIAIAIYLSRGITRPLLQILRRCR